MKIGKIEITKDSNPLIIAELGINHGGDLNVAKEMVHAAYESGCKIIKHQTHIVDDEMTDEAKFVYPPNANKSIWDVINDCSLSEVDEYNLKCYTESLGMVYISTPFSRKAADYLNEINVPAFKIGSGECTHLPLIKHIAKFGKPIILSTGMNSIEQIRPSIDIIKSEGIQFALLECTNIYPSPPEEVSLRGLYELKTNFPEAIIGFSDHSIGPEISLAAVALGAQIIERHFTDSKYRNGPDISCSMDPVELRYLNLKSAEIKKALVSRKKLKNGEVDVYKFARGSVVLDRDVQAGIELSEKDIWARRPGTGEIGVEHYFSLIGRKLKLPLSRNTQLKWSDFE